MAHDDELELTIGDFSRYPGSPGINLDPPLPAYSEEEDDAVTIAMRPLEEQLAQPGPELAWMRAPAPAAALQTPVVASPPAVVQSTVVQPGQAVLLPAPPVARAPSVRPPAAPAAFVPPQVAPSSFAGPSFAAPVFAAPAFVPPAAASRPPPFNGYEPAPGPPVRAARAESVPSLPAPVARAVVPASPRPAAVRPNLAASHARELAQTRSVRRPPPPKGNLLLLAFATAVFALVAMLGTGAVLYRFGVFQPGSVSAAH